MKRVCVYIYTSNWSDWISKFIYTLMSDWVTDVEYCNEGEC